jgi:hypothetical protein
MTSAGELVHLWQRGMIDDEVVRVRRRVLRLPVLDRRREARLRRLGPRGPRAGAATRWAVDRTRRVPWLALPRLATPATGAGCGPGRGISRALTVWPRRRRPPVIDSSKHLSYALLLRHVGLDIRVVLVVRDPRAVAFSWSTVARRPEAEGAFMPRYGWLKSSVLWVVNTAGYGLLRMLKVPTLVVGYEELMADPARVLARIVEFSGSRGRRPTSTAGYPPGGQPHRRGQPMRFRTGPIDCGSTRGGSARCRDPASCWSRR